MSWLWTRISCGETGTIMKNLFRDSANVTEIRTRYLPRIQVQGDYHYINPLRMLHTYLIKCFSHFLPWTLAIGPLYTIAWKCTSIVLTNEWLWLLGKTSIPCWQTLVWTLEIVYCWEGSRAAVATDGIRLIHTEWGGNRVQIRLFTVGWKLNVPAGTYHKKVDSAV
jgi:hypothetical protein